MSGDAGLDVTSIKEKIKNVKDGHWFIAGGIVVGALCLALVVSWRVGVGFLGVTGFFYGLIYGIDRLQSNNGSRY